MHLKPSREFNSKSMKARIVILERETSSWPVLHNCYESSSSSSDFWLTCRYRGHIHNSGPPSRQLACCTHGRSHTRSPGVSIMRVNSWELPLSAIPLCQLLPCHLGPSRPTLSINLYVKGCLDCTVGAFHMSIPAEPSLFQYEVQVFNSEPCK